jgi:hypothetical protein
MVQASPFCGKPNEGANTHLQNILELCEAIVIRAVTDDAIRLHLFPFSLLGKVKQWFYKDKEVINTWNKCSAAFLAKFFPLGKTNALRGKISSFQKPGMESIPEAWERLQEHILACPHHGMDEWLILQSFCNRLTPTSRAHIDAAVGGAFLDLTIAKATALVEKMVSNQGWSKECLQPRTKGMHIVKEADMLSAKMDLLFRRLDERAEMKKQMYNSAQAFDMPSACEVCRNSGHSGNDCLETHEDVAFMNNNNRYCP